VEGTIAAEGLALILEKYDDYYQVIQEMFASSEDFGLTVLVILDNHLQKFFQMVSDMDDVTRASSRERDFLWKQATRFLEKLDRHSGTVNSEQEKETVEDGIRQTRRDQS
jgi:hypothetical protein